MRILGGGGARLLIVEKGDITRREYMAVPLHYLENGGHVKFSWRYADVYDRDGWKRRIYFEAGFIFRPSNWTVWGNFALTSIPTDEQTIVVRINLDTEESDSDFYDEDLMEDSGWGENVLYHMDQDELVIAKENALFVTRLRIPNIPKTHHSAKFIFDGNESMIVAIRQTSFQTDIYSFKTARPGIWKHLTRFDEVSATFKLIMATPTLLYVEDKLAGASESYNILTGERRTHAGVINLVFSPDGRHILRFEQPGEEGSDILVVSPDGSRFFRMMYGDDEDDRYYEITLKKPLPYPVHTQFSSDGKWVRVMSNNKFESSESWGTGADHEGVKGNIQFAAWISRPEGVDTLKKAKEIYLINLTKAIAKEILK